MDDIVEALVQAKDWGIGNYCLGDGVSTSVLDLSNKFLVPKKIKFAPARKEAKEAVLPNLTPDWKNKIKVLDYLNEKV